MSTTTIHSQITSLEERLSAMGVNVHAPLPEITRQDPQPGRSATHEQVAQSHEANRGTVILPDFQIGSPAPVEKGATQPQIDFIKRLAHERNVTHTEGGKLIDGLSTSTPGLTHRRVQQIISYLKAQPVNAREIKPAVRRNRHPQDCERCGIEVPAGVGVLTNEDGHWVVNHEGTCPEVLTAEEVEERRIRGIELAEPSFDIGSLLVIDDDGNARPGRYADPDQEPGEGNLLIEVSEHPFIPGAIVVHDENPYGFRAEYGAQLPGETYRGRVADHLRTIVADRVAAMASFGHKTSTCGHCSRPLRDKGHAGPDGLTSVERGIGPVCASKLGMFA